MGPHVQHYQFESNPPKAFHESFGFGFYDGAIEAYDDVGDGEDGLGKFDECHEPKIVNMI